MLLVSAFAELAHSSPLNASIGWPMMTMHACTERLRPCLRRSHFWIRHHLQPSR